VPISRGGNNVRTRVCLPDGSAAMIKVRIKVWVKIRVKVKNDDYNNSNLNPNPKVRYKNHISSEWLIEART
jgi:hypothetical protein